MAKNLMPPLPGASPEEVEQHDLDVADEAMPVPKMDPVISKAISKKKLKVKALRAGFIHHERKIEGDLFEVTQDELGSWMECQEPLEQKKHVERTMAKKKKANNVGINEHRRDLADE